MGNGGADDLDAQVEAEIAEALGGKSIDELMDEAVAPATPGASASGSAGAANAQAGASDDPDDSQVRLALKRGRVASVQGDDVFIELSGMDGKHQGIVPLGQFERPPRVGSIMDFVVERIEEEADDGPAPLTPGSDGGEDGPGR